MADFKYEIKGGPGSYSVLYGSGYPSSDFIRYNCLTLRGAKRAIRRHRRRLAKGKAPSNRYGIIHTEEALTSQEVEAHIAQLERELGII